MKEKKEKKEKSPMDKAKKKKIIKRVVFGVLAAFVVLFIVMNKIAAQNVLPVVYTSSVSRGDVEQVVSTSGTVKTEESKAYFAPLAVKVGTVDVAAGDSVKKGQTLYAYDEKALADEKQLAELKMQSNEGEYQSSMITNNKYISELGEANINLEVLDQQIEDCENYVRELNRKITDKQDALAKEGALLQISLLDWQNDPGSEEYMNLQKLVQLNTYEQQHNDEIEMWQTEVKEYEEKIASYKEYRSEMKSQKSSSESGSLNSGSKSKLVADTQIEKINAEETLSSIAEVEGGVTADFDGVITEMAAVEGSTPTVGTQMVKLESTEKVKVEISVSKYDLQKIAVGQEVDVTIAGNVYQGKVSKVNGMETTNNSGAAVVGVEIKIENPDSNIFLGVEAKVVVHTDVAEQALVVPIEVINSDQEGREGSFVYAVENGILVKKRVVTGISSNTLCEITEGLNEGDQIVSSVAMGLEEGMAVTAIAGE